MNGLEKPATVRGFRRVVYIALAGFFFVFGMIGVVLPGLPTTPFLLLTSYFSIRSSPWLHRRVVGMPLVGSLIQDWREKRGVSVRVKVVACLMVCVVVALSLTSEGMGPSLKVLIALLAACGICVVLRIPTVGSRWLEQTDGTDGTDVPMEDKRRRA